jgi:hypothetical protein
MVRPFAWAALAVLLAGCAGHPAARPVAPPAAPEAPAARAPRIVVVDLMRVARVHPRWTEVLAFDRQIADLQAMLAVASAAPGPPVSVDIPKVDLTPEMKAAIEKMRPEFQQQVEAIKEAARQELDAYVAQLRADEQRQMEAKRAELEAQLTKAAQDKHDALSKDFDQYQQQMLAQYRLPLLNLKLKLEDVQQSSRDQADQLTAQAQALTKERDDKIAAHEKANQQELQDFQKQQIQQVNAQLEAFQKQLNAQGQQQANDRAARVTARVRTQIEAKQAEFNQRLRGQEQAIVTSARQAQTREVVQARTQAEKQIQARAQSEVSRFRALQEQLQAVQRARATLYAAIVSDVRVEAAALAQGKGWDVVLTQPVAAPGAVDGTDELIARIRR